MTSPGTSYAKMKPDNQSTLQLVGLRKAFGSVQAVQDGNLRVDAAQAVALVGANGAGKSTLMNMLGGLIKPDAGEIRINGRSVSFSSPQDAIKSGIAFVQQELTTFATMSVAENVFIDDFPVRRGMIDQAKITHRVTALMARLGVAIRSDELVENLSTGERQMVEIARAIRHNPDILIFDEPTSSLSSREKKRLHEVVMQLKSQGVAIVYITHFIGEIFSVCDRVTVMKNGYTVADRTIAEVDQTDVVRLMLGDIAETTRLIDETFAGGATILKVSGLTQPGRVNDASFELRKGEIVGLWGLLGSGRTEIARAMLGLDGPVTGTIELRVDGELVRVSPDRLHRIAAFVTEDRRGEGLLMPFSVTENCALPNLREVSDRFGRVRKLPLYALAQKLVDKLSIKLDDLQQKVNTLSGGNQQKVVFGKWLATSPKILILDEPTRGLDVSAKTEILRLTVELANSGAAILLISSEIEELMRVAHRYLIVSERRIIGECAGHSDQDTLIAALSSGGIEELST